MSNAVRLRLKPYVQPFERRLAEMELEALAGRGARVNADRTGDLWVVLNPQAAEKARHRLAYWDKLDQAALPLTDQALRESSALVVRNGIPLADLKAKFPVADSAFVAGRRVLRYGPHGLHEYRGKFFPQLVQALCNVAATAKGDILIDPMCGSGTALVEGALRGMTVYGLDLNPLSVFVSSVKLQALKLNPARLANEYEVLRDGILGVAAPTQHRADGWLRGLPEEDQEYLHRWFAASVLLELDAIMDLIRRVADKTIRSLFLVSVSNVLRRLSFQKEDDLRVRREEKTEEDLDTFREFLEELGRSVRFVLAFLWQAGSGKPGKASVIRSDARNAADTLIAVRGKTDVCITSPPYATALPYLDTDRLSLSYLGLLRRSEQRRLDLEMIGNREITRGIRRSLEDDFAIARRRLPDSATALVDRIATLNANAAVGFRRKNTAALLGKYFLDMQRVVAGMHRLLRRGGHAFMVVGRNHTVAGGHRIDINTDLILAEIAEVAGFRLDQLLPMEMLVSRDIFRANASPAETILFLRKK